MLIAVLKLLDVANRCWMPMMLLVCVQDNLGCELFTFCKPLQNWSKPFGAREQKMVLPRAKKFLSRTLSTMGVVSNSAPDTQRVRCWIGHEIDTDKLKIIRSSSLREFVNTISHIPSFFM